MLGSSTSQCLFPSYATQTAIPVTEEHEGSGVGSGLGSTIGSLDGVQEDILDLVANRRTKGGPAKPEAQQSVESHVAMLGANEESK